MKRTKMSIVNIGIFLGILFYAIGIAFAQEKSVVIKYSYIPGDSSKYSIKMQGTVYISMGNQQIPMSMTMNGEMVHKIVSVVDTVYTHEIYYSKGEMTMNSDITGNQTIPPENFLNTKFTIKTNHYGKPLGTPDIKGGNIANLGISFSSGAAGSLDLVPEFINKPIKVNDEWRSTQNQSAEVASMKMDVIVNYTTKCIGFEKRMEIDCVILEQISKTTLSGSASGGGTDSTRYYIDYMKGRVIELTKTSRANMLMTIPNANMTMETSTILTTTMNLIKQ